MEIYSIGFTQKTAEQFFSLLKRAGIRRLLDVRLKNVSLARIPGCFNSVFCLPSAPIENR